MIEFKNICTILEHYYYIYSFFISKGKLWIKKGIENYKTLEVN